jgi:hypothetical protein
MRSRFLDMENGERLVCIKPHVDGRIEDVNGVADETN